MNSSQRRLSSEAWCMLEALSKLRKSVQKELDFIHSISLQLSPNRLEDAMADIDNFSSEVSDFLTGIPEKEDDELEAECEELYTQLDA